ncbi:hypothetical protein KJ671_03360 [Patescibacteria group bacterium]|nr:hypothetical protein [Patescibacteria group bacterium]
MNYINLYANFLKKFIKVKRPLRVVFDCSNGTSGIVLKKVFEKNKFMKPIFINDRPDGNFPAHGPNPFKKDTLRQLQEKVKKTKANLGVIFDGDGDRVLFVDELGQKIDQDIIGFILTKKFDPPYIATTINSKKIRELKGFILTKVGHLFMKKAMKENKANLGIERSGHYYFKDFFYCDSGIFTAIQIINFISNLKTNLSEYIKNFDNYQRLAETNFAIENIEDTKKKISKIKSFYKIRLKIHPNPPLKGGNKKNWHVQISESDGLFMEFFSKLEWWWFSLRFSNSENLLRLNIEASDKKLLREKAGEIKRLLT